jgi:hypothetical protein
MWRFEVDPTHVGGLPVRTFIISMEFHYAMEFNHNYLLVIPLKFNLRLLLIFVVTLIGNMLALNVTYTSASM